MTAALGILAAAFSITLVWPQVWLSCRHGRTLGLSPTASWLAVGLNACWMSFGLLTDDPAQVVTNAVVGAGNTAVLTALLLSQPQLRTRAALLRSATGAACLAVAAGCAVGAVGFLGAAPAAAGTALGALTSVVGAGTSCVQPLTMLRNRAQDFSGLSSTRWRLGACANASWLSYGVLRYEPAVFLSAAMGFACAVLVCGLMTRGGTPMTRRVLALPTLRPEGRAVLATAA